MRLVLWTTRSLALAAALVALVASSARAVDPKYLPADAEAVITINMKAMFDSELAKTHKELVAKAKNEFKKKLAEKPEVKDALDKAGFDVLTDLHSFTISSNGGKDADKIFLVLEGKFDADKILSFARTAGGDVKVGKVGNVSTVEITPPDGNKTIHAALISDQVIIASASRTVLNEGIARATGTKVVAKAALRKLLESSKANQAMSVVFTADGIGNALNDAPGGVPDNIAQQIQALNGLTMNLTLTKDVSFQVATDVKDNENAMKIAKDLNFGLLFVRGMIGNKAQTDEKAQLVLDLANTLRVTQQGPSVTLRGEISSQNVDRLIAIMPKDKE